MTKDKTIEIRNISANTIDCIESVAGKAEEELRDRRRAGADLLATVHTLNNYAPVNSIGAISDAQRLVLERLLAQPVVARVEYTNEEGKSDVIFVTRGAAIPVPGFKIASYNSPLGRIAALSAGGTHVSHDLEIKTSAKLFPRKDKDGWDSRNTELDLDGIGKFTVTSLRAILAPRIAPVDGDPFADLDDGERESLIAAGFRRAVLSHIALRDRPVLDQHQDEIFRLPINTRCFLSGPPGTGKTTTLIRRLGQKTAVDDIGALSAEELSLIRRVEEVSGGTPHRTSWIMFSPTELLRQYVKEAFAREGFPATDHHIRTWNEYRREIARDYLRLLRTGSGTGPFIERLSDDHVNIERTTADPAGWYDSFDTYLRSTLHAEISADIGILIGADGQALVNLGRKLRSIIGDKEVRLKGAYSPQIAGLREEIRSALEQRRAEIGRIINQTVNGVVHNDRDFLSALKGEIERQAPLIDEAEEDADDDVDLDLDLDVEEEGAVTRSVSREQARSRYERAVIALSRARLRQRSVPAKSRNGRLLDWLGPHRAPSGENLQSLARISDEQQRLRRFANFDQLLLRSIPRLYKRFRAERTEQGQWYLAAPARSVNISWRELDLVVLSTLRMANQIIAGYRRAPAADMPDGGLLGDIRALYRNQVLVDEATDFSVLQLACMYELAHPAMQSFFVCGDINQRLTGWGLRSNDEIDWIAPQIERRSITVAYRQSAKLVALAKDVALLGGSSAQDIELPDRVDNEGLPPVWATDLDTDGRVADWLALRVREIERMVGKVPTIAVLVNAEELVEPLAIALNSRLQDISLAAVACKDGKVVGNDRDVRVFNIEHIKGLEFEAVFFIGLDQMVTNLPDLYSKYLYVGATRAANYLGVTFTTEVSKQVRKLAGHFRESWPM